MNRWGLGAWLLAGALSVSAQVIQVNKDNRTIAVSVTDTASALADSATVHVGFEEDAPTEQAAYAAGSERSNAIVEALMKAGVVKSAIESENQSLQPLQPYEQQNAASALQGMRFKLTQSWTVRTKADDAAKTLDVAVKAGANQSGAIEWEMADAGALDTAATTKAMAHAQATAERMAAGMHSRIGALLYANNQAQGNAVRPMMQAMARSVAGPEAPKPLAISTRRIERTASVFAVFALE